MTFARPTAVALALAALTLAGCDEPIPEPSSAPRKPVVTAPKKPERADLLSEDIAVGTGPEAKNGDKVSVNYTGRLLDTNFMFDTSVGKKPFEFTLGNSEVIKGWDQGVAGMKVGGKRKLTIPSKLGYGEQGSPPSIPGNATLVFDVELLSVREAPKK